MSPSKNQCMIINIDCNPNVGLIGRLYLLEMDYAFI